MWMRYPVTHIPAGDYLIGDKSWAESDPIHQVRLAAFHIGTSVTTNGQYAHFIASGGYRRQEIWSEAGWYWLQSKKLTEPAFWNNSTFNHALQPVVGVSWYEADAFARWMAVHTGQAWHLPSEIEWEAAARGPANAAISGRINTVEMGTGRPWESYGKGNQNWCGLYNMLGNVWEWTSTRWGRNCQTLEHPYPYDSTDGREDLSGTSARVIRGGSFLNSRAEAQPGYRMRFLPGSRSNNIGFRLALS
jgi:formylglycine-generating enzyme required for sulfatase activity